MATAKKSTSKKSATRKAATTTASRSTAKTAAKKTTAKTAVKKTAAKKRAAKTAAAKKASAKRTPAKKQAQEKKQTLIRQKRSTGDGPACWPGFERVPGKEAGTKGSCKPKPNQTKGEKKEDAREAAGAKLRKAGGNKAKANRS